MKLARNILWISFPISIVVGFILSFAGVINSFLAANILAGLIFCLPVTAMLIQTLMNKEKNLSKGYFIIKLAFIAYLYAMIIYMFISAFAVSA
ncbi:MAG: hypothetical protein IKB86_07040 [Clostridia bacterium]|nr:hypothetical protein [Clostridia bacterium]